MSYATTVAADTPTMFWQLEDTTTTAADSSGNSKTGTYSGTYTQSQTGLITTGNCVKFDGSTGKITGPSLSTFTGDFTVDFWAKITPTAGYAQSDNHPVWGGSTKNRFMVRPGGHYFSVWIGGTEQAVQFTPGGDANTNKTIYWAFQRSSTNLNLYRAVVGTDGSVSGTFDSLGSVATTAVDLSGIMANDPNGGYFLNGYIDGFAIYPSALSVTRLNAHYQAGIAAPSGGGTAKGSPLGIVL